MLASLLCVGDRFRVRRTCSHAPGAVGARPNRWRHARVESRERHERARAVRSTCPPRCGAPPPAARQLRRWAGSWGRENGQKEAAERVVARQRQRPRTARVLSKIKGDTRRMDWRSIRPRCCSDCSLSFKKGTLVFPSLIIVFIKKKRVA